MAHDIAPDDIVHSAAEGAANARPPLLILDSLLAFLDRLGLGDGEPEIRPIGDGHSNVTYLFDRGGARFVLRRPPRPPIPPSANDMLREVRVLKALEGRARVPRVLAVCDDERVIGAPFYIMEEVIGHVVVDAMPSALDSPAERHRTGEELIDALVEIHAVDWRAAGLEGFGKPEGYTERQVRRWLGMWDHNKTREIPAVEHVGAWLGANLPTSPAATIVHGDYRLGNVLLAPEPPSRVIAVLDWEMSTIGDPLADVGYFEMFYVEADDPPAGVYELSGVTRDAGWPRRAELLARYEERSGRSMTDIRWYRTLALWKSLIIIEGNYKRASTGQSDDVFNAGLADGVIELAERAEELVRGT
jgi:aminoglycoside phosphotransferase (APT) family kinase protein